MQKQGSYFIFRLAAMTVRASSKSGPLTPAALFIFVIHFCYFFSKDFFKRNVLTEMFDPVLLTQVFYLPLIDLIQASAQPQLHPFFIIVGHIWSTEDSPVLNCTRGSVILSYPNAVQGAQSTRSLYVIRGS